MSVTPQDLEGLDLTRLSGQARSPFDDLEERARARSLVFQPITVSERLAALRAQGFYPHGIFVPEDAGIRDQVLAVLRELGRVADVDERLRRYLELQEIGEEWERGGMAGHWTGQQSWARSRARFRIVAVGRRGGKTIYAGNEAVAFARTRPRSRVWICAPDMDLVSRCFDVVVRLILDLKIPYETLRNSSQHKLAILANGTALEGVSLQDPKSSAGAAVDLAIVDEAAQTVEEAWVRAVLPPLSDRQGQALLISSYEGEGDFFHTKAMLAKSHAEARGSDADWEFFQEPSWDTNFYLFPQGIKSPMIEVMRREMPPVDFLEQYGAIPAKNKSLVYPEFRERVHVAPVEFDKTLPVEVGVDPTGGNSAYALVVWQRVNAGERIHILDEFYQPGTSAAEIDPILKKREWRDNVTDMVVDSAAFTEAEYWARLGWPAYPVHEKPPITERLPLHRNLLRDPKAYYGMYRQMMNDLLVEQGYDENYDFLLPPEDQRNLIEEIEKRLADRDITTQNLARLRATSRIFIHPRCTETIREHKLYRFPKKRPGAGIRDNPVDADNDCMDACILEGTSVSTVRGDISVENVRAGDAVLTRDGYRKVTRAWEQPVASEIVTAHFSDGSVLSGTPDHRVWTQDGWTEMQDLRVEDEPYTVSQCRWNTGAQPFIGTRSPHVDTYASTGETPKEKLSTSSFGKTHMDPFRRAITFITRTTIRSITNSRIWNVCRNINTYLTTSRVGFRSFAFAPTAVGPTGLPPIETRFSFARETAKPTREKHPGSTTRIESVQDAERRIASTSTREKTSAPHPAPRVTALERKTGRFRVYDLTVDGSHEFFANGILVHNCGYLIWSFYRFDEHVLPPTSDATVQSLIASLVDPTPDIIDLRPVNIADIQRRGFLSHARELFGGQNSRRIHSLVGRLR